MHITGKSLLERINYAQQLFNMSQQAFIPANKRLVVVHINMIHHNQTALKRRVGGIYDPHQACLNILINSLKGDAQAEIEQVNNKKGRHTIKMTPPTICPKI